MQQRQIIDTRTPIQRFRRTDLVRWFATLGVEVNDSLEIEKLQTMALDNGFNPEATTPAIINEQYFLKKNGSASAHKRPDLIKKASELGCKQPLKLKNDELLAFIEEKNGNAS